MVKVLVTGGAGYIGSNVVDFLLNESIGGEKFEIAIVDNLSTGHQESVNPEAKFYQVDLTDLNKLNGVFKKFIPDIVLHFAGVSQVGESNKNPEKYYRNNVFGSLCLLRAMVESGCKKIVFSSSAAVYGEPNELPITENHWLKPVSVYGETKVLVENMLNYFAGVYELRFLSLRYFNAGGASADGKYGEIHEPESHLIPNILKVALGSVLPETGKASNGLVFKLFGDDYETKDGTCVRDYIHVEDLARAHVLGMEYLLNGGKSDFVNLGSGSGYSVQEIVEICKEATGVDFHVKIEARRPGDPAVLVAGNKKASELLGWKPKKSIEEIVESAWKFEKALQL